VLLEVIDVFILCLAAQMATFTKILLVSCTVSSPRTAPDTLNQGGDISSSESTASLSSLTFISPLCSVLLAYTQLLVPANLPTMLLLFFPLTCARQHRPIIPPLTTAQLYERKL
jgi:hypothetical protein